VQEERADLDLVGEKEGEIDLRSRSSLPTSSESRHRLCLHMHGGRGGARAHRKLLNITPLRWPWTSRDREIGSEGQLVDGAA
jgi:hypothetical protein